MEFSCKIVDIKRIAESLNQIAIKSFNQIPTILIEASVRDQAIRLRSNHFLLRGRALLRKDVVVDKSGSKCIVSTSLKEALNSMKYTDDDTVKIKLDSEGRFNLSSGDINYKYGSLPENKLPRFDESVSTNRIEIDCEKFKDLITKTSFACGNNMPIKFYLKDQNLHCIAISTAKLAMGSIETDSDVEDSFQVHIDSVQLMHKLANSKTKLSLGWNEDQAMMKCDEFVFVAPQSNGQLPDYPRLLELLSENPIIVRVHKTELRQKLEAFQSMSNLASAMVVEISRDKMHLSLDNHDVGFVSRIVECDYRGDNFSLQISPKMLFEFCKNFSGGHWDIRMRDKRTPILIESVEDESCKFMQSPMIVGGVPNA